MRINKLRQLGFESKLQSLSESADLEFKERVKTALLHFEKMNDVVNTGEITQRS